MGRGTHGGGGRPVSGSRFSQAGRFGRIFSGEGPDFKDDALVTLGTAMKESAAAGAELDHPGSLPAGYTYLGQFIDHDITFDTTPLPEIQIDPEQLHNFRTPKLDLDCLYGAGPAAQPYLYERPAPDTDRFRFVIGQCPESGNLPGANPARIRASPNDLPRNGQNIAVIGDPRNDENLLVAQTHVALLKFHNKVVDTLGLEFDKARQLVTWHYQWIVLHDFLPRVIDKAVLNQVLAEGRQFYRFDPEPFIPIEFSMAAYRFGHSMVRGEYDHNRLFGPPGIAPTRLFNAKLETLLAFTGNGGNVPLPSNWAIDWRRFFDFGAAGVQFNRARRIDPLLVEALHNIPRVGPLSIANLRRGAANRLHSGQQVALAMGLNPLTPEQLATGPDGAAAAAGGLIVQTPLWYYLLKEAEVTAGGGHLGPVGSRLLAEVFIGLLQGDPLSFLSAAPAWTPTLPSATAGRFTMVDLLSFVGGINPVDSQQAG